MTKWTVSKPWSLTSLSSASKARRAAIGSTFPEVLRTPEYELTDSFEISATPRRRSSAPLKSLTIQGPDQDDVFLVSQFKSGAFVFHFPQARAAGGKRRKGASARGRTFKIQVTDAASGARRGGWVDSVIKFFAVKIVKPLLNRTISEFEASIWSESGRVEGWHRLNPHAQGQSLFVPVDGPVASNEPSLLLLHGTFSNCEAAFKPLADAGFFETAKQTYGDRIYAFNHFTMSKTPEQNALELLKNLPAGAGSFDAITHSRGALVLRSLQRQAAASGASFVLRRGVMVAAPNQGTPLATPDRWDEALTLIANILDMFPGGVWATAAGFLRYGISTAVQALIGGAPGIEAMNVKGQTVQDINRKDEPVWDRYCAIIAEYEPSGAIAARLLDLAADAFFGAPNDLVVPTEGGAVIGPSAAGVKRLPIGSVVAFGPGPAIDHMNIMGAAETSAALKRLLALTDTQRRRAGWSEQKYEKRTDDDASQKGERPMQAAPRPKVYSDALQISVLRVPGLPAQKLKGGKPRKADPDSSARENAVVEAIIIASYDGARVVAPFPLRHGVQGPLFGKVIELERRLREYTMGEAGANVPTEQDLRNAGAALFRLLFPEDVRSLYHEARGKEKSGRLNVIFTTDIDWIEALPWEFLFDTTRNAYLVMQDIHFVRHVLTPIPVDRTNPPVDKLKILVVAAQPIGAGALSIAEEEAWIRAGFEALVEADACAVDILPRATPDQLQWRLQQNDYDVMHFIGHGDYDNEKKEGYLLFESAEGGRNEVGALKIRNIVCKRGLNLVFLNACDSGRAPFEKAAGGRDANFRTRAGIAQALVKDGVPTVVANQFPVLDAAATDFARYFYALLATGQSVGEAAREARIVVDRAASGDRGDFAIPVVYARDPEAKLCRPKEAPLDILEGAVATVRRRRGQARERQRRVLLWDIDGATPALRETIARMNSCQSVFSFEQIYPMTRDGAWLSWEDGVLHLNAELLAAAMTPKLAQLGADHMICFSGRPLTFDEDDEEYLLYYGWWQDMLTSRVAVSSTFPDGFPRTGELAGRALANNVVQLLLGNLGGLDCHEDENRCPMFANEDILLDHIAARQVIDRRCKQRFKKGVERIGEELREKYRRPVNHQSPQELLDALEAILASA